MMFFGQKKDELQEAWLAGFKTGMEKAWDLMLPLSLENVEKLKQKIREEATIEAISRLTPKESKNAPNKK